jgi:hypothetical protein
MLLVSVDKESHLTGIVNALQAGGFRCIEVTDEYTRIPLGDRGGFLQARRGGDGG